MKVIAYCRVSSTGQEDGTSLDEQEDAIRKWAARGGSNEAPTTHGEGLQVVHVFREAASGTKDHEDRPVLMEALAMLAADPDAHLVVVKRNRLARSVYVAAAIEKVAHGRVISLDVTGEGPEAELMKAILDAFSQFERAQIAWRCGLGRARRKAEGAWLGGQAPYGLRSTGGKQSSLVVENAAQAQAVKWVFAQHADGATLAEMAAEMNAMGFRTREGRGFLPQTIARMLDSKIWYIRAGVIEAVTVTVTTVDE